MRPSDRNGADQVSMTDDRSIRSNLSSRACLIALILSMTCLVGCPPKSQPPPRGFYGQTEPLAEVVGDINSNNFKLTSLWARHSFEATLVDEKGKSHFVNGDGVLMYRQAGEMLVVGNKDIAGRIFELGTTRERYWLAIMSEVDTMWWGKYEHLNNPIVTPIPIRPDLVMEVLGISPIDTNLNAPPVPVMRFNHDWGTYMLVWNQPLADRWIAQKEIWYDHVTKWPTLVVLYDADGRVVLRAQLSKHERVEMKDVPETEWPVVATDLRLYFPHNQTRLLLSLRDTKLVYRGVPKDGSIKFPDRPNVSQIIQIDAEHEPATSASAGKSPE